MTETTITATETVRNGVDTTTMFATLDAIKAQPEIAEFRFRARNRWLSGTHSQTTIYDFFGLGAEQTHLEQHEFEADHPTQLVAADHAPTPAEYLLHALAACITAGIGNIAAARGVELTRVESTVTGDIDLVGLLGLDPTVRNGYQGITVRLTIEGDAAAEELKGIVERSIARSAVFDVLTRGTSVAVEIETT